MIRSTATRLNKFRQWRSQFNRTLTTTSVRRNRYLASLPASLSAPCSTRPHLFQSSFFSAASHEDPTTIPPSAAFSQQQIMGSSLSRLLTDDQRLLLRRVHELSARVRSLAKDIGNVPAKEDSLLEDIAALQTNYRRRKARQRRRSAMEGTKSVNDDGNDDDNAAATSPSLFTVVVAGEFNSGKSTLINALLGKELLDAGALPTTDAISVLMANDENPDNSPDENLDDHLDENPDNHDAAALKYPSIRHPSTRTQLRLLPAAAFPLLSDLCLIDTPGTNAILSLQHTPSTLRILHDADLILFVTCADRPFSESERQLLQTSIKSYRKRVLLVINKMDTLERIKGEDHGDKTKRKVVDYVTEHASDLLGARPVVIPVSARDALSVKLLCAHGNQPNRPPSPSQNDSFVTHSSPNPSSDVNTTLWKRSNFATLEHYLSQTLTASSKIKTKLLNPLGVIEGILRDCQHELQRRCEESDVDAATLRLLQSQTKAWEHEMDEDLFQRFREEIQTALHVRGHRYVRVLEELSVLDQWKLGLFGTRSKFDSIWTNVQQSGWNAMPSAMSLEQHLDNHQQQPQSSPNENSLQSQLYSIVDTCAETFASRAKMQGNATIEYLGKRPAIINSGSRGRNPSTTIGADQTRPRSPPPVMTMASGMVGTISPPKFTRLHKEFQSLLHSALRQSTIHQLPNDSECANAIYSSLQKTVLISTFLYTGALGPAASFALQLCDASTAIVGSTALAVMGAVSFPLGNKRAMTSFEREWKEHADKLDGAMEGVCKEVLRRVGTELAESVGPYSRYVKGQGEWLKELEERMENDMGSAHGLRSKINKVCE